VTGVVYSDLTSIEVSSVECIDRVLCVSFAVISDKTETTRISVSSVFRDVNVSDVSVFGEFSSECFLVGSVGEIVDLE